MTNFETENLTEPLPPPTEKKGWYERQGFSPASATAITLVAIFFVYQGIGGIIEVLLFGASITTGNVQGQRLVQGVAQYVLLALPTFWAVTLHTGGKPFDADAFRFLNLNRSASANEMIFAMLGVVVLQPALSFIGDLQTVVMDSLFTMPDILVQLKSQSEILIKKLTSIESIPEFFFVTFVIALTPALCEEVLFRGYVQRNLSRHGAVRGAVLTGVIFGCYHLNLFQIVPLVLIGIYIAYLQMRSESLVVPMVAHFANNFFSVLGLFAASHSKAFGLSPTLEARLKSEVPDVSSPDVIVAVVFSLALFVGIMYFYNTAVVNRKLNQTGYGN
jgi:membrane protease YdiL (CAAX protease family)